MHFGLPVPARPATVLKPSSFISLRGTLFAFRRGDRSGGGPKDVWGGRIGDHGWLTRPASSNKTLLRGSDDSRFATADPADPAPTMCFSTEAGPHQSTAARY